MSLGIIFAVLTTLSWSIGIFPFTEACKRLSPWVVNPLRLFLAWILMSLLILAMYGHFNFIKPFNLGFWLFAASGFIGFTVGDYFSFSSFVKLGPRLGSLFTSLAPVSAGVCAWWLLNETLSLRSYAGILLIILAVVWIGQSKSDARQAKAFGFQRDLNGMIMGTLGAFCQGLGLVLSKWAFTEYSIPPLQAVWIRLSVAFVGGFVLLAFKSNLIHLLKTVFKNQSRVVQPIVWGTLLGPVTGVTCSLYAIQYLPAAVAQAIFALLPLVILPINRLVYKEPITFHSLLAALVAIIGVLLLI